VNYYDTSNLYGPSQMNYHKAFQKLDLIPGVSGYNETLRRSFFLTSKTHLRFAKGGWEADGLNNWTNGKEGSKTVDDIKRSLSQLFGDGKGNYPEGAYLNMVLIHSLSNMTEVDALYEGLYDHDPKAENIGALAALKDYRDGTNLTGLNPGEEKLIRHIGFSGHYDARVMMEMIRRDRENLLDGMLVAINSNDKLQLNMQNNVIPVAKAKNMGVIGMKVFADGAMYSKPAHWSGQPSDVVREVGSSDLPFKPLVQYTLTTSGISTAIMGIGHISNDPHKCQLTQDIEAAQISSNGLSKGDREDVEQMTRTVKDGETNYFQHRSIGLSPVQDFAAVREDAGKVKLSWDSAYAGDFPLSRYEIYVEGTRVGSVDHKPQTSKEPFTFEASLPADKSATCKIVAVDEAGHQVAGPESRI
jgi:aryl-alcohol dehydrogenase-like predicted oxidoreductase